MKTKKQNGKFYKPEKDNNRMILPGDPQGLPDGFFNTVVFIDNAYLIRLKKYFFQEKLKYNLNIFIKKLAEKNKFFVEKIFLYDAPPYQDEQSSFKENEMKERYDQFVSIFKKDGIIVREGRTQRLRIGDSFIYKQKGVDMLLGIDMVSVLKDFPHIKSVILLTGDSDFVPVVEKLNQFNIQVFLLTYFERKRRSSFSRSNYLIKSVSKSIKITKQDFEVARQK